MSSCRKTFSGKTIPKPRNTVKSCPLDPSAEPMVQTVGVFTPGGRHRHRQSVHSGWSSSVVERSGPRPDMSQVRIPPPAPPLAAASDGRSSCGGEPTSDRQSLCRRLPSGPGCMSESTELPMRCGDAPTFVLTTLRTMPSFPTQARERGDRRRGLYTLARKSVGLANAMPVRPTSHSRSLLSPSR